MKAISLWQPYASAMALGLKQNETRSWYLNPTGELTAICAAKKQSGELRVKFNDLKLNGKIGLGFYDYSYGELPFGFVVAVGRFCASGNVELFVNEHLSIHERLLGDYSPGRFVWRFENIVELKNPVSVIGRQGIFNLPPDVEAKVRAQL